ncbi:ribosome small subunit-dependent GTPase A [Arthrobacter sp. RCC_34]|uniref:ribosome small subunit-dependent GTPase A n=1 Tax=Arthrobacter sp. RCC_34 TaxID=3239230 RepID=UPI0035249521
MTSSLHETFESPLLRAHGWDPEWQDTFSGLAEPGTLPARVLRAERGLCEVITAHGPDRVQLLGSTGPDHGIWPTTGDWISMVPGTSSTAAHLGSVLPRRTLLARATAGGSSQEQALAANVDTVVVTVSLASPLRHSRTERLLALAWASGATPVVALTKADTHPDPEAALEELGPVALGVRVVATSAETEEGVEELRAAISGTVALIGPSGAGKSSLGNRLLGAELLATGDVRAVDGKGRHTTAWRELLLMPDGGVLLDTPGLRSAGVTGSEEGVSDAFSDLEELSARCRFSDCAHTSEPGCAVQEAIAEGTLTERRLQSYRKLQREAERMAARTDARLRSERLAQMKSMAHQHRAFAKERGLSKNRDRRR